MALFKNTDEIKQYVALDGNTKFVTIDPYINEAEQVYIKPLLGTALYDLLLADYNNAAGDPNNMTPIYADLLPYTQRPLANYSFYLGFESIATNIGDMGVRVNLGNDSMPAPKWQQDRLKARFLREGDRQADVLLTFLEENKTDYPEWANSPSNTIAEGMILPNAVVASDYININESRRLFLQLKKYIVVVEQKHIKPLICKDQYNELVDQIKNDTLTAENQLLVDMLRPIIAKHALYLAIPTMRLVILPEGLFIYSTDDGNIKKEYADSDMIKNYREGLKDDLTGFIGDEEALKKFIDDNIADYPKIQNSDCYTMRADPGPKHTVPNDSENKYFAV